MKLRYEPEPLCKGELGVVARIGHPDRPDACEDGCAAQSGSGLEVTAFVAPACPPVSSALEGVAVPPLVTGPVSSVLEGVDPEREMALLGQDSEECKGAGANSGDGTGSADESTGEWQADKEVDVVHALEGVKGDHDAEVGVEHHTTSTVNNTDKGPQRETSSSKSKTTRKSRAQFKYEKEQRVEELDQKRLKELSEQIGRHTKELKHLRAMLALLTDDDGVEQQSLEAKIGKELLDLKGLMVSGKENTQGGKLSKLIGAVGNVLSTEEQNPKSRHAQRREEQRTQRTFKAQKERRKKHACGIQTQIDILRKGDRLECRNPSKNRTLQPQRKCRTHVKWLSRTRRMETSEDTVPMRPLVTLREPLSNLALLSYALTGASGPNTVQPWPLLSKVWSAQPDCL